MGYPYRLSHGTGGWLALASEASAEQGHLKGCGRGSAAVGVTGWAVLSLCDGGPSAAQRDDRLRHHREGQIDLGLRAAPPQPEAD